MKKIAGTGFLLLSLSFVIFAQPVDQKMAASYAEQFLKNANTGEKRDFQVKSLHPLEYQNRLAAYVISFEQGGWVYLAADKRSEPIIGYSRTGSFNVEKMKNAPYAFFFDAHHQNVLDEMRKPLQKTHPGWNMESLSKQHKSANATVIEPLIPVEWDQDAGWNAYSPEDPAGPDGHTYAGCVAVAMGQAMSVYAYPDSGFYSHAYSHDNYGDLGVDYSQMHYNWDSMMVSEPNKEIARFLYHLGVAVEMDFTPDGSGTISARVPYAFKKYFDYSNDIDFIERSDYEKEEWDSIIIEELKAGRPVYYAGNPERGAGHAFNVDGVDNQQLFHLNWGWGGQNNGYFNLKSLTPAHYDFSFNQQVVINIEPRDHRPYDILLSNASIDENQPEGTVVGKVSVLDETPEDTHSFALHGPMNIFTGEFAQTPFYVEDNGLKSAEEFDYDNRDQYEVFIGVTDGQ